MINLNKICVFDFETDGIDTNTTSPVELAAVMIDPRKIEIIPDSEFSINIRPTDIDEDDYYEKHKGAIDFHARNQQLSHSAIIENWKKGTPIDLAWDSFHKYIEKYHSNQSRKTKFSAPVPAGWNIVKFDLPIVERLNNQYNIKNMFHPRDLIDGIYLSFMWFENQVEPSAYNFDTVRAHVGISKHGAHRAIKDVEDCAQFIMKMMKLHRNVASKVIWK